MGQNQSSSESGVSVPKIATLDGFREFVDTNQGIFIKDIPSNTILKIVTLDSVYTLIVADVAKKEVLVRGGKYLPEPTSCMFNGSTFGGANIVQGWIGIQMCMEIRISSESTITTSPVRSIGILSAGNSTAQ